MAVWTRDDRILISWDNGFGETFTGLAPDAHAGENLTGWSSRSGPGLTRVTSVPGLDLPAGSSSALRADVNCIDNNVYGSLATTGHFASDLVPIRLAETEDLVWRVWLSPGETEGGGLWNVGIEFYGGGSLLADPEIESWQSPPNLVKDVDIWDGWSLVEGKAHITDGADSFSFVALWSRHAGDTQDASQYMYMTQCQVFPSGGIDSPSFINDYHHYVVHRKSPAGSFFIIGRTRAKAYLDDQITRNGVYTYEVYGSNDDETSLTLVERAISAHATSFPPKNIVCPNAPARLTGTEGKSSVLWNWFPSGAYPADNMLAYFMYDTSADQPKYVIWSPDMYGELVTEWREPYI